MNFWGGEGVSLYFRCSHSFRKYFCEHHKIACEHKKIAHERHKIAHEHQKLVVSATKLSVNVCSDTKCRLVPIKLRVVRLPRLRLPGFILGGDTKMSAPGVTHVLLGRRCYRSQVRARVMEGLQ